MSFSNDSRNNTGPRDQQPNPARPSFNTHITSHRLRESSTFSNPPMASRIRRGRRSIFKEVGLSDDEADCQTRTSASLDEEEFCKITGLSPDPLSPSERTSSMEGRTSRGMPKWFSRLAQTRRPKIRTSANTPPPSTTSLHRLTMIAVLIAVVLPAITFNSGRGKIEISGADAGLIRTPGSDLHRRDNSPTDVCTRWAGQSAIINGTVYYYGGRSKTSGDQTSDTWNNDFITVDLTKSWDTSSPAISGLPQPSGPPAVSLGYLWNDLENLFLYGGEFSDTPVVQPSAISTWQYNIASSTWSEFDNPQTSAGNYSDPAGVSVQRAAEGAGVSVPELGVSWYFGGHLDYLTTPGWSNQIARVYLKSLLEFTHPGYANSGVDSLRASGAPDGGAYRNITWSGTQNQDGFTERADGVLVYVPGWGEQGILLGLGGGVVGDHETTDAYAPMDTIDVYDIKSSTWYHQETSGTAPQVRVNPCAVIFSAPDASSFNIFMYGGQNLLPYGNQTQYTDMWILTVPSFTWIKADVSGNEPPARAGHSCEARDGQMVVIGGYVGTEIACDRPGIYNFDASNFKWQDSFTAADHAADADAGNSVLAGSYGYQVNDAIQSVVGGSSEGGATATQPASGPATGGPFKTGTAPVFTVTAAGATSTVTNVPTDSAGNPVPQDDGSGNPGLIAAGVIAGLAGVAALYLGYCAWLYRRQVAAYKRHMLVANRYSGGAEEEAALVPGAGGAAAAMREKLRKHQRGSSSGGGGNNNNEHFSWVGQLGEPKWMSSSEDRSPGSGTGSSQPNNNNSGGGRPRPSEDRSPWGYDSYMGGAGAMAAGGGNGMGHRRSRSAASRGSTVSGGSAEALLDGREPNFFSVVLGPRRALRVVNGLEE
ncbi:hypothetical protein F4778DRAFT_786594 [Xylariomycetidae sp. FL2044]|nr:hypothetical protein F4778DRAFT_786594 [Xylariomycetidae sp. FL2044]